jgi:hypothetical protein
VVTDALCAAAEPLHTQQPLLHLNLSLTTPSACATAPPRPPLAPPEAPLHGGFCLPTTDNSAPLHAAPAPATLLPLHNAPTLTVAAAAGAVPPAPCNPPQPLPATTRPRTARRAPPQTAATATDAGVTAPPTTPISFSTTSPSPRTTAWAATLAAMHGTTTTSGPHPAGVEKPHSCPPAAPLGSMNDTTATWAGLASSWGGVAPPLSAPVNVPAPDAPAVGGNSAAEGAAGAATAGLRQALCAQLGMAAMLPATAPIPPNNGAAVVAALASTTGAAIDLSSWGEIDCPLTQVCEGGVAPAVRSCKDHAAASHLLCTLHVHVGYHAS